MCVRVRGITSLGKFYRFNGGAGVGLVLVAVMCALSTRGWRRTGWRRRRLRPHCRRRTCPERLHRWPVRETRQIGESVLVSMLVASAHECKSITLLVRVGGG